MFRSVRYLIRKVRKHCLKMFTLFDFTCYFFIAKSHLYVKKPQKMPQLETSDHAAKFMTELSHICNIQYMFSSWCVLSAANNLQNFSFYNI